MEVQYAGKENIQGHKWILFLRVDPWDVKAWNIGFASFTSFGWTMIRGVALVVLFHTL